MNRGPRFWARSLRIVESDRPIMRAPSRSVRSGSRVPIEFAIESLSGSVRCYRGSTVLPHPVWGSMWGLWGKNVGTVGKSLRRREQNTPHGLVHLRSILVFAALPTVVLGLVHFCFRVEGDLRIGFPTLDLRILPKLHRCLAVTLGQLAQNCRLRMGTFDWRRRRRGIRSLRSAGRQPPPVSLPHLVPLDLIPQVIRYPTAASQARTGGKLQEKGIILRFELLAAPCSLFHETVDSLSA